MLSYDQWADDLAAFFFDEAHGGSEVLFSVDDITLADVSGLQERDAVRSLADAVRTVVGRLWSVAAVANRVRKWRREGAVGAHPALPFLALTVLAAAQMGSEEDIAPHNYYRPLRRLLDQDDDENGPPGTFTDYIEDLWSDVVRWANEDLAGRRGRLVVRDPGFFRYVGLAFQHALLRGADLRHLDAFFRRIGLLPGEDVSPAELRRGLAAWSSMRSEPWARRLARVSAEPALATFCEDLLGREARQWDGRPRDPRTGRPTGRIRLGIRSARRPAPGFYAQWDERLPKELHLISPLGATTDLRRWEGWYEPLPLPINDLGNILDQGLELRTEGCRFYFREEDAFALEYDDDLGCWVSIDTMSYGDRHQLLVRRDVAEEVVSFLRSVASECRGPIHSAPGLPKGWSLISDVRIDARPRTSPPVALASLLPAGTGPRLRLLGGLQVGVGNNVYLRGGEPAVAPSVLTDDRRISIERVIDRHVVRVSADAAENGEYPLWELHLEPGIYEISQGESRVRLQIVDGIAETAGPGAGEITQRGSGDTEVSGTIAPPSEGQTSPCTVFAPFPGDSTVLIGPRANDVHIVSLPIWLSGKLGFQLSWSTMDAWPGFVPSWQLWETDSGYEALLLEPKEPEVNDDASRTSWAKWIRSAKLSVDPSAEEDQLWGRYLAAAGGGA